MVKGEALKKECSSHQEVVGGARPFLVGQTKKWGEIDYSNMSAEGMANRR